MKRQLSMLIVTAAAVSASASGSDPALILPDLPAHGFAGSFAVSGEVMVVGARFDDEAGKNAGAVVIYELLDGAWTIQEKITAIEPVPEERFGTQVAVRDDVVAVAGEGGGVVHVFRRIDGRWTGEGVLMPWGRSETFGGSVSVGNDFIAVGDDRNEEQGELAGAVYVFRYDGGQWLDDAKLLGADIMPYDRFGRVLAVADDLIAVGVEHAGPASRGVVYFFAWDGASWVAETPLESIAPTGYNGFGLGLAVSPAGDRMAVADRVIGTSNRVVFVLRLDGGRWVEEGLLRHCDAFSTDWFGDALAMTDDLVVVGARRQNNACYGGGCDIGAAYVFSRLGTQWGRERKLAFPDALAYDSIHFGEQVAVSGTSVLVSAPGYEGARSDGAIVHYPALPAFDCNGNGFADSCDLASFASADCDANGLPDECQPDCNGDGVADGCELRFGRASVTELVSTESGGEHFGRVVVVDGDRVLVTSDEGESPHLFRLVDGQWTLEHAFGNDGAGAGGGSAPLTLLGNSGRLAALDGDVALIGGPDYDSYAGIVLAHRSAPETGWDLDGSITPSDPQPFAEFGLAIALEGDVALVGAPGADDLGAAYVFEYDGDAWIETAKLTPPPGTAGDEFGRAVALEGDLAVVGMPEYPVGSVFLYEYERAGGQWTLQTTISAPTPDIDFGRDIALEGDTLAVGAPELFVGVDLEGGVYVYRRTSEWVLDDLILPDEPNTDRFGFSVALSGDDLLVGVVIAPGITQSSGAAYLYRATGGGWSRQMTLIGGDGLPGFDTFGLSVDIDGARAVVGGPLTYDDEGRAYVFDELQPMDVNGNGVPDDCETTCPGDLDDDGFVDVLDLIALLQDWGVYGIDDLIALILAWGPC